jgi:hypothetical protein
MGMAADGAAFWRVHWLLEVDRRRMVFLPAAVEECGFVPSYSSWSELCRLLSAFS